MSKSKSFDGKTKEGRDVILMMLATGTKLEYYSPQLHVWIHSMLTFPIAPSTAISYSRYRCRK